MLYPIKFKPIIKEKVWGGTKLSSVFNKDLINDKAGESWEISGIENSLSEVINGPLKGKTINELIKIYECDLMGKSVYRRFNNFFPLLIKFIDASDDLSVQVHPDDITAQLRHKENGKNEMWYIVDADHDAELILGVKNDITRNEYTDHVKNKTLSKVLNAVKVQAGDAAYIPAGRIHAIMKGVLLAEIQQCSDITYRIYDWDRKDLNGNFRQLHTDYAKDIVDLKKNTDSLITYNSELNKAVTLCKNDYFNVNLIEFDSFIHRDLKLIDSFVILMCIDGTFRIKYKSEELIVHKGETILIPACIKSIELNTLEKSKVLEIFI